MTFSRRAKRWLDFCAAFAGLLALGPLLLLVAIALRFSVGPGVLFRHQRPGLGGAPFDMFKFRTMREPLPGESRYHSDEARITRVGHFLRKSSIDELPELYNVLRGDMSLVGPRPLLMEYLEKYDSEQMRRHDMPPGITGWAAVNGRNDIPFSKRLELDVWYVDNWSFWLDIRILGMTIRQVIFGKGVQVAQQVSDVDDLGLLEDVKDSKNTP